MKLITNENKQTHLSVINRLLKNSDEVIICVAFLKNSGLSYILKKLPSHCTFYIGTDFYLTEPNAIKKLYKRRHTVYLTKKRESAFHPKIYYFRQGDNISILTGSANLTGSGLDKNFETSVLIQTNKGSSIYIDFHNIIKNYLANSIQIESDLQLSQYEREYETYKKKHKKADKEFKDEIKSIHKLDLTQLNKFVKEYIASGEHKRFSERTQNYKTAKHLMNKITKTDITSPSDFLSYYDIIAKSFYSSGLLRGKTKFSKEYKTILSVIKEVQENKKAEPIFVFSKTLPLVKSIKRFGVNALTEIMNTYNPNNFSVANGRTLKSLSDLGFKKFPAANDFNIDTYENYNNLIKEIASACQFKDLGQVDHFLNWYYEKYVKRKDD